MAKRIILCSDGTGNRGGKTNGTNVWRLFKAVDLGSAAGQGQADQIAFYDDGVGTEDFKLIKLLGGAFGWGLSRNVKELYASLCRSYEPGDDIYLFGFSRGAYTVRVLGGLICACGIVDRSKFESKDQLKKAVDDAYSAYRWSYKTWITRYFRWLFPSSRGDRASSEKFRENNAVDGSVPIRFIGVWDTVDAVGLPIDELADAINTLIYRFKFENRKLSSQVRKACHAIAIDDERHTFHPVPWDEQDEPTGDTRIEQVWFAGMHSNVGGGYPKDQLAHVPLDWMMTKAEETGLRFIEERREDYRKEANPHGRMYDSRSGLAAFYRYRPRNVGEICELNHFTSTVHPSVLGRIAGGMADYAPVTLPTGFHVYPPEAAEAKASDFPEPGKRAGQLKIGRNNNWWRRILYFVFLAAMLAVVYAEQYLRQDANFVCAPGWCLLQPVFGVAKWLTPEYVHGWIDTFQTNPLALLIFVALFAVLFRLRGYLANETRQAGWIAWQLALGKSPDPLTTRWYHKLARAVQRSPITVRLVKAWNRSLPAIGLVLAIGIVSYAVWILCRDSEDSTASVCNDAAATAVPLKPSESLAVTDFDTGDPCRATPVTIVAGETYRIDVDAALPWKDKSHETDPAGFPSSRSWVFYAFAPFRRSWEQDWFTLMGQIGSDGNYRFAIGSGRETFTAKDTGRLYLYVNDAVCYVCWNPWYLYTNNQGTATITVTRTSGG